MESERWMPAIISSKANGTQLLCQWKGVAAYDSIKRPEGLSAQDNYKALLDYFKIL